MKSRWKLAAVLVLSGAALVAGACASPPQGGREVDRAVHAAIIEAAEGYKLQQHQTKVLAGCIDWQASTPENIAVIRLYSWATAYYGDAPIFTSQLMSEALGACRAERSRADWRCDCVAIDKNGTAVLQIPEPFRNKFMGLQAVAAQSDR